MSPTRWLCCCTLLLLPLAAASEPLFKDYNNDGTINVLAFGDSITAGEGDGTSGSARDSGGPYAFAGTGYTGRLESWLSMPVKNAGLSGEELATSGVPRLASILSSSNADLVLFMEGINDALFALSSAAYRHHLQKAINLIHAAGKEPVVATLIPPCCLRSGLQPAARAYSAVIRDLARINSIPLVDLEKAWDGVCRPLTACELLNTPEGLHPNKLGYDAMAETFAAALLGIDLFGPGGTEELEGALGWPAGTVIVRPEAVVP